MTVVYTYKTIDRTGQERVVKSSQPKFKIVEDINRRGEILVDSHVSIVDTIKESFFPSRLKKSQVITFLTYLKDMFEAGISIVQAVSLIEAAMPTRDRKSFGNVFQIIADNVKKGYTFSESLERTGVFPELLIANLKVGEKNGTIEEVIREMLSFYESELAFTKKVKQALIQPAITFFFALLILTGMLLVGIPKMKKVAPAKSLQGDPLVSFFVGLSDFVVSHFYLIPLGAVLVFVAVVWTYRAGLLYKLPLVSDLIRVRTYMMLFSALSVFQRNGFPIIDSVITIRNAMNFPFLDSVAASLRNGTIISKSFGSAISEYPIVQSFLSIGEATGKVDTYFDSLARYFKNRLEATLQTIVNFLPVAVLFVLGGVVAIVLLVAYKLIYGTMSEIAR